MSSSDEDAEIYGIENGYGNPEGEADNIGLTRRDRRAAKRDQKKWDERKEQQAMDEENEEEEDDDDDDGDNNESESESEISAKPQRGRPRKYPIGQERQPSTGRGSRGRRGRVAQDQRLLPFGRRGAPRRGTRGRSNDDNEIADPYFYRGGGRGRGANSRSQRAKRRNLKKYDYDDEDDEIEGDDSNDGDKQQM